MIKKVKYKYHHVGIPSNKPRKGEKYSSIFKMYTTKGDNEFRIQWHRYEAGCPLHPPAGLQKSLILNRT